MSTRLRFSYAELHHTIAEGAAQIIASDFQFDVILAIGGGGFIPARILRTYVEKPLIAISLARYHPDEPPSDVPHKLQWVEGVNHMITGKRVLIVDEVDDERTTLAFAIGELLVEQPAEIGVFVMHNSLDLGSKKVIKFLTDQNPYPPYLKTVSFFTNTVASICIRCL